jgi:hypothetical protein
MNILVQSLANPEAIISAAVAANSAAQSAYQAFIVSMIILGAMVLMTLTTVVVAFKFNDLADSFRDLEKNTNSIKDALVDTTRKLALVEGRGLARAEIAEEERDKDNKENS